MDHRGQQDMTEPVRGCGIEVVLREIQAKATWEGLDLLFEFRLVHPGDGCGKIFEGPLRGHTYASFKN